MVIELVSLDGLLQEVVKVIVIGMIVVLVVQVTKLFEIFFEVIDAFDMVTLVTTLKMLKELKGGRVVVLGMGSSCIRKEGKEGEKEDSDREERKIRF